MITLKNANILYQNKIQKKDILIDKKIIKIADDINEGQIIDCISYTILPSFIDPHVHFREPGYEYKETILNGSKAAAKGGYTDVFMMPNLKPCPSDYESLKPLLEKQKEGIINCHILGSITKDEKSEELSKMDELNNYVVGFSDDGKGVKTTHLMYQAMLKAKALNKPILAHVEDEGILYGGCIREGIYNKKENLKGILAISETVELARDLVLAEETKVQFHMCHISCRQSLELIKYYKKTSNISVEVTPHHLLLNENDMKNDGAYKMNPPLASIEDQKALIEGIKDGSIDMIATDHAPHAKEEKNRGLEKSLFGIVGIENAFALLYTNLVMKKVITLEKLIDLMSLNISKVFHLKSHEIKIGNDANLVIVDLNKKYLITEESLLSKSKSTPFINNEVNGEIKYTILDGGIVYEA